MQTKLGKQDFHYEMSKFYESITENQERIILEKHLIENELCLSKYKTKTKGTTISDILLSSGECLFCPKHIAKRFTFGVHFNKSNSCLNKYKIMFSIGDRTELLEYLRKKKRNLNRNKKKRGEEYVQRSLEAKKKLDLRTVNELIANFR